MFPPLLRAHGGRRPGLTIVLLLLSVACTSLAMEPELADGGHDDDPSATERTVREALREHGLPIGLLPRGARAFRIDEEGRFEVRLDRACNARFEGEVRYDANVTGTLSYGQIGALSGISAQELFLWFPVKGIRVDDPSSGLICFDVEVVRKQFPLSLFETPPDCVAGEPPSSDLNSSVDKSKSILDQKDAQRTAIQ